VLGTSARRGAACLVTCTVLFAAGGAAGSTVLPPPGKIPGHTVVLVSHVGPELGRITKREFQLAMVQAAAQYDRGAVPKPGENGYEGLKNRALGEELDFVWIEGQAAEMGIVVTRRQVSSLLAQIKKQAFKDEAAFREFLRESRYTRRDVRERVRVQILVTRIQRRITRRADTEADQQEAFSEFVVEYERRWRARTVCAQGFVTVRCSNGPPADAASRPLPPAD
jgi:SurA-like protein